MARNNSKNNSILVSKYPSISVAIATYNSGDLIERCLKDLRSQNYPQEKIEIILGDGGSTDQTCAIAKKYKAKVVRIPKEKQHAEYNRGVAFNKGKGELSLIIDHDNYLPDRNWLKKMVKPLIEDPEIVATTTCYYHYDRNFSLMDRYFALFGTSEPLPFYLNKADRMMWGEKKWTLLGSAFDRGDYFKVRFKKDPRKVPSIGTNGTLMRTAIIKKHAKSDPDNHYPIDVMVDVVMKGYVYYGFVKTSIIHLTHSKGIWQFLKRRKRFVEHYHFEDNKKRRWSVVMKGDWPRVLLYVFYSITFVVPFLHSIKGYLKVRDIAWFVHPFMCFGTTAIYTWVTIVYFLKSLNKK